MEASATDAPSPQPAQGHSPRRINTLARAIDARSYLEIGVFQGATFKEIDVADKTAVDPNFRFAVEELEGSGTQLHEVASDAFFAQLSPATSYDLIFLDGLHTFEQTYRDFCSCLLHIHPKSIILIDDTCPNDPYSALPSMKTALRRRTEAGLPGLSWHGDVYKVIWALHDFHPSFDYRTIIGSGNPQTLAWRAKPGEPRAPALNSLEAISRLTYFDFLDNPSIFHRASEADAIKACLSSVLGAAEFAAP